MTLALAVALFVILQVLLRRTKIGRIVRATADNAEIVRLMGVRPASVYNIVMGLSFALAGIAGLMLALRTTFTPFSGVERLVISFEVVVMGGLGSFWGVVVAAMIVGLVKGLVVALGYPQFSEAAMYVLMLFVLLVRPRGLFGERIQRFE